MLKADRKKRRKYIKNFRKLSKKLRNFEIGESFRAFVDGTEAVVITNASERFAITNRQFEKLMIKIANANKKARFVEWVMHPLKNVPGGTYNIVGQLLNK